MLTVRQASFRGVRDFGSQRLAEVEVHTGNPGDPEYLAYFREGPKGYQLVRVLTNDADTSVDWYDNDMHNAFQDVTATLFHSPSHAAAYDRNAFAEQVLGTDGVRQDLDLQFRQGGR